MMDQQAQEPQKRETGNVTPPGFPDTTEAHADGSLKEKQHSSIFERCTAAMRRPLWCFPQSSVEPPLWDTAPFLWLAPVFGFSPTFWLLLFNSVILCWASYFLESTVCMTSLTVMLCLVGMCAHEFAYASAAYAGGAKSVAESGYLTCDVLQYMDAGDMMVSWISIIFGGFIVPGSRIYVDTTELRNRRWRTATSLAGPLTNLFLALLASSVVRLYLLVKLASFEDTPFTLPMPIVSLICFVFLQVVSCFLNLLPFPPFDGWNAIEPYIPRTFWVKACIANDFVWERLCHLAVTLIFYLTITHVPLVWEGLSLFVATISGLPPQAFLACMQTMMNPFSTASVTHLTSALFIKL
ncbi:hypothetical protein Emed_003558 [Eimeria media]